MLRFLRTLLGRPSSPKRGRYQPDDPNLWIDPTFVLVKRSEWDCDECGCPGWTCVNATECPRSADFQDYRMKLFLQ